MTEENPMADIKITVNPDGPLSVKGNVDLVDKAGHAFPHSEKGFALCRCGQSNNKPFCDGTHARTAFKADTKAPEAVNPAVPPGA
jgi:CDGSH-type Zn-finger protein